MNTAFIYVFVAELVCSMAFFAIGDIRLARIVFALALESLVIMPVAGYV